MFELDLRKSLELEQLEVNLFRGVSPQEGAKRIYGGQVIAQALLAAYKTVEERICHSLHCYFIRPGDPNIPIIFEVDRARDGQSFTTRRVIAIQHGRQIFNFAASFQVVERGFTHQFPMPTAPAPEGLRDEVEEDAEASSKLPEDQREPVRHRPIEVRWIDQPLDRADGAKLDPHQNLWFRSRRALGDDPRWHQVALAYASDMALLGTSMRPHGVNWRSPGMQTASLDHAMWFHEPTDFTQWHLYEMDSPSAAGARGFSRGSIFRQDGTLVASCVQEGLIRQRKG